MTDLRLCPFCVDAGGRSRVYEGTSRSTLMWGESRFWDEDGTYHSHDINKTTTFYRCSKGHNWSDTGHPRCPNCDWGKGRVIALNEGSDG